MAGLAALTLDQLSLQHSPTVHRSTQSVTVFCDFDGPIVDVSDRYYSTYKLGLAEVQAAYPDQVLQLHVLSKAQFWQMKQERTPDPEIALRSGLRGKQIEMFLQCVRKIVNQPNLLDQDQLQPGTKRALSKLHAQGVQLVLVTLRRQSQAMQLLQQFGIAHLFTQIYGASDDEAAYLNQAEHKTQLLAEAMKATGLRSLSNFSRSAHAAWMIGDTEADILAGHALGIATIALTCGIRSQTYLQRFTPTHVHTDLVSAVRHLMNSNSIAA